MTTKKRKPPAPEPIDTASTSSTDPAEEGRRLLGEAYEALADGLPLSVRVSGRPRMVMQHVMSSIFPVVSRAEFEELVADVLEHGFREPVTLTNDGQILEGRHRAAVSMATGLSLNQPRDFEGTEAEARDLVVSANIHRRHLTAAQRALLVREIFLPTAVLDAAARMRKGVADPSAKTRKGKGSAAIAAAMAGDIISARSIEAMAPVDHAPGTKRRILSGEISSVSEAVREAEKECTAPDPDPAPGKGATGKRTPPGTSKRAPNAKTALTRAHQAAEDARKAVEAGHYGSTVTTDDLLDMCTDLRGVLTDIEDRIEASRPVPYSTKSA